VPSWHTTVVVEFAGTTTVVFAGGFGLPLLMQPHSIAEATTSADKVFICFLSRVRWTREFCVSTWVSARSRGRVPS
jgi:hypothetical protein